MPTPPKPPPITHEQLVERIDALERRIQAYEVFQSNTLRFLEGNASHLHAIIHRLERAERQIMAVTTEQRALITRFNDATNKLAARLRALEQKVRDGGATAAEEAEFLTELGAVATTLEATGADPENPVPTPA